MINMKEELELFLLQISDYEEASPGKLIEYFVYFVTVIQNKGVVLPSEIEACFDLTRLSKYSNISSYLARNSKRLRNKKAKFIKTKEGYQLERTHQLEIQKSLRSGPAKIETSYLLRTHLSRLKSQAEKAFLQEAIDCYEIGARRSAIVMVWILTMYHLYEYTYKNALPAFNSALNANTDKRIKINKITKIDDFTEIPENKFIEFARTSKIITNDVRKILEQKLGIRNSSAHPSGISISQVKATDFIIDLIDNVISKYII